MIRLKTVIVLGAGASRVYGYPSGRELRDQIVRWARNEDGASRVADACSVSRDAVQNFYVALRGADTPSIDEFLNQRKEFRAIGKAAITDILIPCEARDPNSMEKPRDLHLYEYLWHRLLDGRAPENFHGNELAIISFNYDRSLEYYLHSRIKSTWGLSDEDARKLLKQSVEILHPHGRLAGFPWEENESPTRAYGRPARRTDQLAAEASRIKIVHDEVDDTFTLQMAQRLLSEAALVIFLGFGYHRLTMDRLEMGRFSDVPRGTVFHGTRLGFTNAEVAYLQTQWHCISFGAEEDDCLMHLRAQGHLLQ